MAEDKTKRLEETDYEELHEDAATSLGLTLEKKREEARRIVNRRTEAEYATVGRETKVRNNMALYEGKQYSGDGLRGNSPWVVKMSTPYASVAIDTRVSSLISDDYRGELFPISPKDEIDIQGLNTLIQQEFNRSNLNRKINDAISTSAVVGEGYLHVRWRTDDVERKFSDGRKGYIEVYEIENVASVLPDPEANSLKEGRWMIVKSLISKHEIKQEYPEFYNDWIVAAREAHRQEVGEVYTSTDTNPDLGKKGMVDKLIHYEKVGNKIHQHIVINDYLVETAVLDGLRDFPVVQMRWKKEKSRPFGISLMDDIGDLQRAINAIETAITNVSVTYAVPSYALRKGSGVNPTVFARSIGVPGAVISVNGNIDEAIKTLPFPSLDASILNSKDDFMAAIDRIAGITNPFLGTVGTAGNTAEGTHQTIERAKIIEKIVLANIEVFVEDLTEVIIQFVTAMYSGTTLEQMVRESQNEYVAEEITLTKDIVDKGYNFYINLSARTTYSRQRDLERLDQLWQQQNQYDDAYKLITQKDLIMAHDMEDKEIYADRFDNMQKLASEETAQMITEIVQVAQQYQIDPQLLNAAISEMILMKRETPALDALGQAIQEAQAQQAQMKEQGIQEITQHAQELGVDDAMLSQSLQGASDEMFGGAPEGGGEEAAMDPGMMDAMMQGM